MLVALVGAVGGDDVGELMMAILIFFFFFLRLNLEAFGV